MSQEMGVLEGRETFSFIMANGSAFDCEGQMEYDHLISYAIEINYLN